MRILFVFVRDTPYDAEVVRQLPSGGTEKATIFLMEALQRLGYQVFLAATDEELKTKYLGQHFDFVVSQDAKALGDFPNAKRILWLHQFWESPYIQERIPYAKMFSDQVVTLSACQQYQFASVCNIRSTVTYHGIGYDELAPTIPKQPYSLIYASTPYRGLSLIPDIFRKIKAFQPQATITICSSMNTYGMPESDAQYQALFDEVRQIEGVNFTGSLNMQALYREMAKSRIFLYPCIYPETYCMAMDEAMAHGCIPVVTELGALPERFPASGRSPDELVQMVRYLFERPDFQLKHFNQVHYPFSWDEIAQQWRQKVFIP